MAGHLTDIFSFRTGAVRLRDLGYLLAARDGSPDSFEHTALFEWDRGEWGNHQLTWSAHSAAVCSIPNEKLVALGASGNILIAGQGEAIEEDIYKEGDFGDKSGSLREIRVIAGKAHVVGMDRQVFRRDGRDLWVRIDTGLPSGGNDVVGLESIHGFSGRDIYAVGWDGEIWHYNGRKWSSIASPTNALLTRVLCAGDGSIYACGQGGLLLRGHETQWEIIDQDETTEDFWDIEWFSNRLYISTMQFLYVLENDSLQLVDFGDDIPDTCYHLTTADGVMWSIGPKDVMVFDGKSWSRID